MVCVRINEGDSACGVAHNDRWGGEVVMCLSTGLFYVDFVLIAIHGHSFVIHMEGEAKGGAHVHRAVRIQGEMELFLCMYLLQALGQVGAGSKDGVAALFQCWQYVIHSR